MLATRYRAMSFISPGFVLGFVASSRLYSTKFDDRLILLKVALKSGHR